MLPAAAGAFAVLVVFVNLFLGLFNLIPIPPFDGYTILINALPYRYTITLRSFEQRIAAFGPFGLLAVLFIFIFLLSGPFYSLVMYLFRIFIGG